MGRPKGALNRNSQKAYILAQEMGADPLKFLLNTIKGDWEALGLSGPTKKVFGPAGLIVEVPSIEFSERLSAALGAAKFCYQTLKPLEIEEEGNESDQEITVKVNWDDETNQSPDAPKDTGSDKNLSEQE